MDRFSAKYVVKEIDKNKQNRKEEKLILVFF